MHDLQGPKRSREPSAFAENGTRKGGTPSPCGRGQREG